MIKKEYLTPKVSIVAFHVELGAGASLDANTSNYDSEQNQWDGSTPQPEGPSTTNYFETNW